MRQQYGHGILKGLEILNSELKKHNINNIYNNNIKLIEMRYIKRGICEDKQIIYYKKERCEEKQTTKIYYKKVECEEKQIYKIKEKKDINKIKEKFKKILKGAGYKNVEEIEVIDRRKEYFYKEIIFIYELKKYKKKTKYIGYNDNDKTIMIIEKIEDKYYYRKTRNL